jgi:protein CpxP
MKTALKPLLIASLLAVAGLASHAQTPPSPTMDHGMNSAMHGRMKGPMDPAQREGRMAKHLAELKTQLKLTPAQEGAWTTFTTAMKPAAGMDHKPPTTAEMDKLTTPERIDKMHAMHSERMAQMTAMMERHGAATKTFYGELSTDQKKVFDAAHGKMMRGREHMRGKHSGMAKNHAGTGGS